MKKAIRILTAACLCAAIALSVACSKKEDAPAGTANNNAADTEAETKNDTAPAKETVALKVWAPTEEQELTIAMCQAFKDAHPEYDITFEYAIVGVDESIDGLKKDADVAGDVFLYPSGGVPELVQAGLIYPLTVDADTIKSIHGEAAIKSCTLEGKLYGVPVTPNSWFMYYDKSKYSADEVKSLETMLAKDLGAGVQNFSCNISNSWYISAFFYAAGATLFGADGTDPKECSWNGANGVAAGNYLIDLVNNQKYVEDIDGVAGTLMREGKLAALCSGTWSADSIKEALGDNYGAAKLPTINVGGADRQLSNFADFKAWGVKSSTKYPKAAQQLAAWLSNEQNQLQRFETNNTAPTVVSLLSNPSVAANKEISALSEQTRYSTPNPSTSKLSDYWGPAGALGAGIYNKEITKANLQEKLDACVTGILSTLTN